MRKRKANNFIVSTRVHPDGHQMTIWGRVAWALDCLNSAGPAGCTPHSHPGPRWSAYVHKLRGMGFKIETLHETHGGQFSGHHARYVLKSKISLVVKDQDEDQREAA